MNITEVIIAAGSTMEAVYYYEHIQLIEPARENNQRIYSNQDSGNIRFIERMLRLGLTPDELHVIFEIKRTHQCTTPVKHDAGCGEPFDLFFDESVNKYTGTVHIACANSTYLPSFIVNGCTCWYS
ncbi:MerR family transcriptional regulator [Virgibacillus ihumii]|uniref:MerR family transcriptional regulator n=1 Tax=Virgibacillus ihumii TaxID=2686091 RepID=UPI00157C9EAD|nr:MerR family transcriptional regulator [Virgibacillus ihumii]